MNNRLAMDLQYFAEGGDAAGTQEGTGNGQQQNNQNQQTQQTPLFDYEKLASIISGKQTVAEDTVLKNFFKQQGLSQEEMNQAIRVFKEEKAKNTPDVAALQTELANTNKALIESKINEQATLQAMSLGLDSKAIPYVIKMADMSKAVDEEGKISAEEVKKALEQVLTDVPALKGSTVTPQSSGNDNVGGFQIGGAAGQNNGQNQEDILRGIFGIKK